MKHTKEESPSGWTDHSHCRLRYLAYHVAYLAIQ